MKRRDITPEQELLEKIFEREVNAVNDYNEAGDFRGGAMVIDLSKKPMLQTAKWALTTILWRVAIEHEPGLLEFPASGLRSFADKLQKGGKTENYLVIPYDYFTPKAMEILAGSKDQIRWLILNSERYGLPFMSPELIDAKKAGKGISGQASTVLVIPQKTAKDSNVMSAKMNSDCPVGAKPFRAVVLSAMEREVAACSDGIIFMFPNSKERELNQAMGKLLEDNAEELKRAIPGDVDTLVDLSVIRAGKILQFQRRDSGNPGSGPRRGG